MQPPYGSTLHSTPAADLRAGSSTTNPKVTCNSSGERIRSLTEDIMDLSFTADGPTAWPEGPSMGETERRAETEECYHSAPGTQAQVPVP